MSGIFDNKVALVTGAARGIGAATARMFVENGAKVVLADLLEDVRDVVSDLGENARSLIGSVGDPDYCKSLVDLAESEFGHLDFAFNNAGIGGKEVDIEELGVDDWNNVIKINLSGVFYGVKCQVPALTRNGGGVIINTSSVLGIKPIKGSSLEYTAAKHGVIGLTRQLAVNYGGRGIRCNAICPGFIETTLVDDQESSWFINRTPQG
ncbi:MAG: SDR family NAD(P)-dependent oxidoreductase, partial [Woeseiaceae bacterium]